MAANSKDRKFAQSCKLRFEQLGCPYTEGVEESWITDLIFRPGEPRIRILQWLFSKFDSSLNDVLDPHYAPIDNKMDSRIQRLLYVASSLGLCRPDDADLIRGASSVSKQAGFIDMLLDMVCIMDAAEDPQTKFLQSPGFVCNAMTLDEQFMRDSWYLDSLGNIGQMDQMFATQAKLLPPDIVKKLEKSWDEKGYKDKTEVVVPDTQRMSDQLAQLEKDLVRQKEILQELDQEYPYQKPDPQARVNLIRTLRLVLSELSQLVVGFSYCFENEMHSWCNREAPRLNQLGPCFKRVNTLLQIFSSMLNGITSVRHDYSELSGSLRKEIQDITEKSTTQSLAAPGASALDNFKECIDIMETSIQRHNKTLSTSPNTTINSSVIKFL